MMVALLTTLALTALPAPPPTCPAAGTKAGARTLIVFTRIGGVAGVNDRLTIRADGRSVAEFGYLHPRHLRRALTVSCTERRAIVADLARARFLSLPTRSPKPIAPDRFDYSISYRGHTVRRNDAHRPHALFVAYDRLGRIVDRASPGR